MADSRARPSGAERCVRRMEPAAGRAHRRVHHPETCLAAGGAGEVWRARDERLGREVAIKILLPHFASDAERLRRFADEARTAGALNHPNILTVYDVGEHRGIPFLVSECLEGQSLRQRIDAGAGSADEAVSGGARSGARPRGRPRTRNRSSRPQAGEHLHQVGWRREDSRLRPGEAPVGPGRRASQRAQPDDDRRHPSAPQATWRPNR